ncbi:MAG: hypothetical protein IPG96_11770 [Proteobacteria bacterium]|nr:hypothetical protein [Pseudomonadota bacterium]
MRAVTLLAVGCLLAGLALGCGSRRGQGSRPRASSGEAGTSSGALLAIGLPQLPVQLDPLQGGGDVWAQRLVRGNVVEALFDRGPDDRAVGRLARAAEWRDQGRTLRLSLRRGVRFHDGRELTSAEVAAALDQVLRARSVNPLLRLALADIAQVTTPAADVVELRLTRVNYQLPRALAALPIVGRARAVDAHGAAGAGRPAHAMVVGTGPYQLGASAAPGTLLLRRFAGYWGAPPAIASVELRAVPDAAHALGALRNAEIDVLAALHPGYYPAEVSGSRFDRRFFLRRLRPHQLRLLWFNLRRRLLDDRRVRLALARLADGAALATALGGEVQPLGRVLWGPWGSAVGGAGGPAPIDGAALLNWSGWQRKGGGWRQRDGRVLVLRLLCAREGPGRQEAEQIARRLREAGVGVSVELGDFGFVRVQLQRGNFDLALSGLTVPGDDELALYLHSDGALNFAHYESSAADAVLDALRTALPETDRSPWHARLLQLLAEDPPWAGLYVPRELSVVSRRVEGWADDGQWPELATLRLRAN